MTYETLLHPILSDWSFWDKDPAPSIIRSALKDLPELQTEIALVVQGVRRCGKSTLLSQIMQSNNLPQERCFFLNFEDPRLSDSLNPTLLDGLLRFADTKVGNKSPRYFFLDEIQVVKEWEKWLRVKLDRPQGDIFIVTGSNSALLSGELGSVLTGRQLAVELFPFSFVEYLKIIPEGTLQSYLQDGGFPKPLQSKDSPRLLRQYFTDIIERDVRRHVAARSIITISQVAKALFESAGSELSARSLAKRVDISADTMLTYLEALSRAYLVLPCEYFTYSERKRIVRNKKWYPIDCGLRKSVITTGSPDIGKSFETIVFHKLRQHYQQVYYWRDSNEVDFIVMEGNKPKPIQVSWDGIKECHKKGIADFIGNHTNSLEPVYVSQDNFERWIETLDNLNRQ